MEKLLGLFAISLLVGAAPLSCPSTVRDAETLQPVSGAKVVYRNASGQIQQTVTDASGQFVLTAEKNSRVFVEMPGYFARSFDAASVKPGATLDLDPNPGAEPTDTDGDGLTDVEEEYYETLSHQADTDNDGLPDGWEVLGRPMEDAGRFYLPVLGSDPLRKDVFLEIDWMEDETISEKALPSAINPIVRKFAAHDIALHVDWGRLTGDGGNAVPLDDRLEGLDEIYYAIKDANFAEERMGVYHYCLFAHRLGSDNGLAEVEGDDLALGIANARDSYFGGSRVFDAFLQQGTLIHELGHNFVFRDGGYQ